MSARRAPWPKPKNSWLTLPRPPDSPKVFTIPASAPFSATLAKGLLHRVGAGPMALAEATVYLPTRRAARSIAEVFAREAGGATLLPEFRPLGDVDEDELLLDPSIDALDLKPAIAPLRRRLLLAALIRRWSHSRDGGTMSFGQAAGLARSLAAVMDEAETQGADLSKLDDLAPAVLAEHWADVKAFLSLIRDAWPALLETEGRVNPAAHRNEALRTLAMRLQDNPPARPIIAAGSTGSIPATAALLGVIARLPRGAVVLPGLDRELDTDDWERVEAGHPQFALKQLLERIGVRRDQVGDWAETHAAPERERLLREVLRPAPTTDAWRALAESVHPPKVEDLSLIEASDPAEEASAIALMLREGLETPDLRAALVTRDRGLARRVTAELGRWAIAIDDSAGRPLSRTPVGSFLCLLAEAADERFAPVPLLALLKHPLARMDGDAPAFRANARALDKHLRGPRPDSGLKGIAAAIQNAPRELQSWFARLAAALGPLEATLAKPEVALINALKAHVDAAEALTENLWSGPDGLAANRLIRDLSDAAADLPDVEARSYAPMIRDFMDEVPVRPSYGRHPRLAILGPLEARLQSFDLVILGGLNEGSWPASAADDPWFSRPMRATLGLEPPERAIGLSAHDFACLAAQPRVVLTRAMKSEGTPMVASRWVQRLEQLTKGLGIEAALAPAPHIRKIAAALADSGKPTPVEAPYPCPDVAARPRRLSVTEIETWLRDPYAIYAKRILRLRPLDPLDAEIGPMERGTALHAMLERFVRRYPALPPDAVVKLGAIVDEVLGELGTPKATLAVWRPRFLHAAAWFVDEERQRRDAIAESFVEVTGEMVFKGPAGDFTLYGRADRIDRLRAGGAAIIDYKTGTHPNSKQVNAHLAPQLPLEGAMLASGGFKDIGALAPAELIYVRVSGAAEPGKYCYIDGEASVLARDAAERLAQRIAQFDDINTGYESRVAPFRSTIAGDYDHLARVHEWSVTGWSGE
jgi:ATP-dependent helicase/nuclease subunit B